MPHTPSPAQTRVAGSTFLTTLPAEAKLSVPWTRPNPWFGDFFGTGGPRREKEDLLLEALLREPGVILMHGPSTAGKSCFLQCFLERHQLPAAYIALRGRFGDLLDEVLPAALGIPACRGRRPGGVLPAVEATLRGLREGRGDKWNRPVLVVDDVDTRLPPQRDQDSTLRLLEWASDLSHQGLLSVIVVSPRDISDELTRLMSRRHHGRVRSMEFDWPSKEDVVEMLRPIHSEAEAAQMYEQLGGNLHTLCGIAASRTDTTVARCGFTLQETVGRHEKAALHWLYTAICPLPAEEVVAVVQFLDTMVAEGVGPLHRCAFTTGPVPRLLERAGVIRRVGTTVEFDSPPMVHAYRRVRPELTAPPFGEA